jgi:uncharacterized protein
MPGKLNSDLQEKYDRLNSILLDLDEVVVAMSGGVDSVLLAKTAFDMLGDKALAVTADSPSLPRRELAETIELAGKIGINHKIIITDEMDNPQYASNPVDRCYYCKSELFDHLQTIIDDNKGKWIIFGENIDDQSDYRPGSVAAKEHRVRAPLKEAGLSKNEIRLLAQFLGIPIWNKPASACLASRIPYGEMVTPEKLAMVEQAENFLWDLGFRGIRVRHHGEIARIEASPESLGAMVEKAEEINDAIREIGFLFVTLDLGGYRRGSLNEGVNLIQIDLSINSIS